MKSSRRKRKREDDDKAEKRPCHRSLGLARPDESILELDDMDASRIDENGNILISKAPKEPLSIMTHLDIPAGKQIKTIRREELVRRASLCLSHWAGNTDAEKDRVIRKSAQTRILLERLQDSTQPFVLSEFVVLAASLSWDYFVFPFDLSEMTVAMFTFENWVLLCRYDRREQEPLAGFCFVFADDDDD